MYDTGNHIEIYTFLDFYIPLRMMDSIERYVQHGVKPGRFLSAVISNNLKDAVAYADDENMKNIPAYVNYFYNKAPGNCWGSPEKMKSWSDKKWEAFKN